MSNSYSISVCGVCGDSYHEPKYYYSFSKIKKQCPLCVNKSNNNNKSSSLQNNTHLEYRSSTHISLYQDSLNNAKAFFKKTGYCEHFEQFQIKLVYPSGLKINFCKVCEK